MFRQLRSQKGLTLVELMVVVAIIAIIAAVAITVFQDIQKKAKLAADQANVASMRSAVAIYYGKHNGLFPAAAADVYALVTPALTGALGGNSFHCAIPTYTATNGKVDYTATIANCP
jgi:prepilin-type N-terminal cleavage/methylation domain-containing protein